LFLKILKFELTALFFLTVISFISYYYAESLPDNYFWISSQSSYSNWFTYYLTSFITFVGYISGPWIFFPFFIFCFLYAFLFSKREFKLDVLNVVPLMLSVLLLIYFSYPGFIGKGLIYFLQSYIPGFILLLLTPIVVVGFLALCFRQKFFDKTKEYYLFLKELPEKRKIYFDRIKEFKNKIREGKFITIPDFKLPENLKMPTMVKKKELPAIMVEEKKESLAPEKIIFNLDKKSENQGLDKNKYFLLMETVAKQRLKEKVEPPKEEYFNNIISSIENKLAEFKISGEIINVLKGPVVDTFELVLGPGIKVSKITNHAQDLSLALFGVPIRIVYPMKGRTTVGIEVPRNPRQIIYLDEILHSKEFKNSKYALPISMGKDAFGEVFVSDLASMPHMLVAGATGAGKSVFINSILFSLLIKKTPDDLKLILIDPKQLELALYADLPHLAMPVITEASAASNALRWATLEMERGYSILKEFGVRNIEGFNEKLPNAGENLIEQIKPFYGETEKNFALPFLVIIVDEFADLILTKSGKDIENNICRIAAKARAAGIHLVLATQRPSVDVITGLIKSNFPTRVSFKVTTSIDSRTILNNMGAELLLGKGDMLYKSGIETLRIHGAYVGEDEIEELAKKLRPLKTNFDPEVVGFLGQSKRSSGDTYSGSMATSGDELFSEGVKIVLESKAASASMLQRRLKIGYNRAANLIEEMESKGIVGPADGSKPRKVLSKAEEFIS
jgi:DNA segregation ATPase FtsK/SpoIIIE, S-DNA-T family